MALFFKSHICNDICKSLGLTQFDMAPSELKAHETKIKLIFNAKRRLTTCKGLEEPIKRHVLSPIARYLQQRMASYESNELTEIDETDECSTSSNQSTSILSKTTSLSPEISINNSFNDSNDDSFSYLKLLNFNKPRPSAVSDEKNAILNGNTEFSRRNIEINDTYESILGGIHFELCKYYENGRFLTEVNDKIDYEAAFFHLKHAAYLGVADALKNAARIFLQLPHDILADFQVEVK